MRTRRGFLVGVFVFGALWLMQTSFMRADRVYEIGQSLSYTQTMDRFAGLGGFIRSDNLIISTSLVSSGPRSTFNIYHDGGVRRFSRLLRTSTVTSGGASYSYRLSERLTLTASDTIFMTPFYTSTPFLKGISFSPSGLLFQFGILIESRNVLFNTAAIGANYVINPRSSLSFGYDYTIFKFPHNSFLRQSLINSTGSSVNVSYNRNLSASKKVPLTLTQAYRHYDFAQFGGVDIFSFLVGGAYKLGKDVALNFSLGPTITRAKIINGIFIGVGAVTGSWAYSKKFRDAVVTVGHSINVGPTFGLGGVGNNQTITTTYFKRLTERVGLRSEAGYFRSRSLFNTAVRVNGYLANSGLTYQLTKKVQVYGIYVYYVQHGMPLIDGVTFNRSSIIYGTNYTLPNLLKRIIH